MSQENTRLALSISLLALRQEQNAAACLRSRHPRAFLTILRPSPSLHDRPLTKTLVPAAVFQSLSPGRSVCLLSVANCDRFPSFAQRSAQQPPNHGAFTGSRLSWSQHNYCHILKGHSLAFVPKRAVVICFLVIMFWSHNRISKKISKSYFKTLPCNAFCFHNS